MPRLNSGARLGQLAVNRLTVGSETLVGRPQCQGDFRLDGGVALLPVVGQHRLGLGALGIPSRQVAQQLALPADQLRFTHGETRGKGGLFTLAPHLLEHRGQLAHGVKGGANVALQGVVVVHLVLLGHRIAQVARVSCHCRPRSARPLLNSAQVACKLMALPHSGEQGA